MLRMILAARQQADVIDAHVRDIADEQAVLERGPAAVEQIDAEPVVCVRLLRKMQFLKRAESCIWPRCSTDTPPPHGLV